MLGIESHTLQAIDLTALYPSVKQHRKVRLLGSKSIMNVMGRPEGIFRKEKEY